MIGRAQEDLGDGIVPEMWTSQVEALTPPCRTLSEVRAELVRLRRGVTLAAEAEGARIAAASTHPFSPYREQRLTPKERYWQLVDREQQLAHEQVVFGFHVHVGLEDRAAAIEVMNRARVWLAPMLALSASSPFWLGEDTGYASFRTQVWGRLPTTGPPAPFSSPEEHDALVEALVASGGAAEASQVYWDIRRPQKVKTVEIRVFDVCSDLDETVMIAGLSRALVRVCREEPRTRGTLSGGASGAGPCRALARLPSWPRRPARRPSGGRRRPGPRGGRIPPRLRAAGARGAWGLG